MMPSPTHWRGRGFSPVYGGALSAHHSQPRARGRLFFLAVFTFSCCLFWWLPSILYRLIVHQVDPVSEATLTLSAVALAVFIAGFSIPTFSTRRRPGTDAALDACGWFAYRATILLFPAALLAAVFVMWRQAGFVYGSAEAIPRSFQALFYVHLFIGFACFGAAEPETQGWRHVGWTAVLVTLPRAIVALHGGRFFLAQAVVPALLIAIARGWIRFSVTRILQICALGLAIVFVPPLTRGDAVFGQAEIVSFFAAGSTLQLFQQNQNLDLNGYCDPLVVSLTAKLIPWSAMGACVFDDYAGLKNMPATLDRILTVNDPMTFNGTVAGTGSNFLLELYLFGGLSAVFAGSALFGFSCARFCAWVGKRSLFAGIWAECLTRALFAPRSDLGYVYERIPSLIAATWLLIGLVTAVRFLQHGPAHMSSSRLGGKDARPAQIDQSGVTGRLGRIVRALAFALHGPQARSTT